MSTDTTTTKTRHQHHKAVAIAATFRALGLDEWEPGRLSDTAWKLAARAAWLALPEDNRPATQWTDISSETRQLVADMLREDERTADDVFAAIAGATALTTQSEAVWYQQVEEELARRLGYSVTLRDVASDELWESQRLAGMVPAEAAQWALDTDPEASALT